MQKYDYRKVDAFTSATSLGNPAACVYLKENETLTPDEMLHTAAQHKGFVCEMVFCKPGKTADYELTYYSSECEVDFCGHGTIATLYALIKDSPELMNKEKLLLQTHKKGVLPLYNKIKEEDAVYITAPDPIYIGTDLTAAPISDALHIKSDVISSEYPIDLIDAGLRTLIVPITQLEDEISIFPDRAELETFCIAHDIDIILIYSMNVSDNHFFAHTRVFSPKFGYLEDPATGSGNSAFGYYLIKNNRWNGESIAIEQGGNDRVFNTVKLTTKDGKVLVGGSSTTRIEGFYYI